MDISMLIFSNVFRKDLEQKSSSGDSDEVDEFFSNYRCIKAMEVFILKTIIPINNFFS